MVLYPGFTLRSMFADMVRETWVDVRDFVRNVYWPNRGKYTKYFLMNFSYMEKHTVMPAIRLLREGVSSPMQLNAGFSLQLDHVIHMKGGRVTDYAAKLKGKDGNDVLVWRRSNDRVHFEFVDRAALRHLEEGDTEGRFVIRLGTI